MPGRMKKRSPKKHFKNFGISILSFLILSVASTHGFENAGIDQLSPADQDIPCEWTGIKKIVAVGDLHGAYKHFVEILWGTDLMDGNYHWTGGKTHLVQIGDVLDRGDGARDIFDLIRHLEKEAEEAGGMVHMLLGNHEEMNLANTAFDRQGYITPGQFSSFLPEKYRLNQEKRFSRRAGIYPADDDSEKPDFSKQWQAVIDKGIGNMSYAPRNQYYRNFIEQYGQWLLSKNIVIKINDIVFVHGGINETFSVRELKDINDRYRTEMFDIITALMKSQMPKIPEYEREIYNQPRGPLWHRELAEPTTKDFEDDVARILENLKAEHIIIAHTPQLAVGEEKMKRYGGKVWIIDTGIADYYRPIGGHVSALIYEEGEFHVWYPEEQPVTNGKTENESSLSGYFFFKMFPVFPSQKFAYNPLENKGEK